jgi:hypothetical protein
MMDDSIVYWLDEVRAAIRGVDPTGLVTLAFFGNNASPVGLH